MKDRFLYKSLCLLFCVTFVLQAEASGESKLAYVVVTSSVSPAEAVQPRWIAFQKFNGLEYVSAKRPISAIRPGKYRIDHIDFGYKTSVPSSILRIKNLPTVDIESGKTYFFGRILLKKSGSQAEISLRPDSSLILEACISNPHVFETHPLINVSKGEAILIDCDKTVGEAGPRKN